MFDFICSAANYRRVLVLVRVFWPWWNNILLMLSWLDQKRASTLVGTACENLAVLRRSRWKQQQCISRCSHVHCLLPHMGMFSLCLCPCVSRQDILNYFAQLPPWTLATARQYTHHADTTHTATGITVHVHHTLESSLTHIKTRGIKKGTGGCDLVSDQHFRGAFSFC